MSNVVARLIMTNHAGLTRVIEVKEDASFHNFYLLSTKAGEEPREINRNFRTKGTVDIEEIPGLIDKHAYLPELQIASSKVEYPDRAKYEELLNCPPDELGEGLTKSTVHLVDKRFPWLESQVPVRMTDEYRQLQARRAEMFGWDKAKAD